MSQINRMDHKASDGDIDLKNTQVEEKNDIDAEPKISLDPNNICVSINHEVDALEDTPTSYHGVIHFADTSHNATVRFIWTPHDTDVEKVFHMMLDTWHIDKPEMIVSLVGAATSMNHDHQLLKEFRDGFSDLVRGQRTWVISDGCDSGLMKTINDLAASNPTSLIGIVNWNEYSFVPSFEEEGASVKTLTYKPSRVHSSGNTPKFLDHHLSHLILVDTGKTNDKQGIETIFRRRMESYIIGRYSDSRRMMRAVQVVVGGDGETLSSVVESLESRVPCVIVKGSGGLADVIAQALTCLLTDDVQYEEIMDNLRDVCLQDPNGDEEELNRMLSTCVENKELFTITNANGRSTMISALLNSKDICPTVYDQLYVQLTGDGIELTENDFLKVFSHAKILRGAEYDFEKLDDIMIMALALNRPNLVKFLFDQGVHVKSILSQRLLEFLYGYRWSDHLSIVLKNVEITESATTEEDMIHLDVYRSLSRPDTNSHKTMMDAAIKQVALGEIAQSIENLVKLPHEIMKNIFELSASSSSGFEYPLRQLFIWAVLNNMLDMALLFCQQDSDCMAKILLASDLTEKIANKISSGHLNKYCKIEECYRQSSQKYIQFTLHLLDECHTTDQKNTVRIITHPLQLFSFQSSSLEFAVSRRLMEFVSHVAVQNVLNDAWNGALTQPKTHNILMCILCPLLVNTLEMHFNQEFLAKGLVKGCVFLLDDDKTLIEKPKKECQTIPWARKCQLFFADCPRVRFHLHVIGYVLFLITERHIRLCRGQKIASARSQKVSSKNCLESARGDKSPHARRFPDTKSPPRRRYFRLESI